MKRSFSQLIEVPPDRQRRLGEILERIEAARRIVLTTHVNADGDGAGSQAAVARWLGDRGTDVRIINPTPFPEYFRFLLHRHDIILDGTDPRAPGALSEADLVLVMDTGEAARVAPLDRYLSPNRTVVIDHHPPGPDSLGGGVQDPTASATGELVHDLIAASGSPWTDTAATGVYVAIVSDTGSFRFSNTTPRAHVIAARMLSLGVDPEVIFQKLFATAPMRRLELLREALGRLELDERDGIAWMVVPREITDRLGSTHDDYEGLIDHVRSLEGTQVSLLFRETGPRETKVSWRSVGGIDVNRIARRFGGGGHAKAAGATIPEPYTVAVPRVLQAVREVVRAAAGDEKLPPPE